MQTMTQKERVANALDLKPVDTIACSESFWGNTTKRWIAEGHLREEEDLGEHFGLSIRTGGWLNSVANLDFEPKVLEETSETVLTLDGNGATLRRHKQHESTPEHVDFAVKERAAWEEHARPFLVEPDRRRIPFEGYREARQKAADNQEFFCWAGVAPFEQMHPVCGHEYMLMGMALDPDWITDMVRVYSELTVNHLEILFAEEGLPDGMFFYEDMGFKNKPFMSPQMYEELVMPGHKRLFDFAHAKGLKVIVHSCGYVEPLVPGLVRAGMDCLQAMEVKAGMDMPRLHEKYGKEIAFFGNMDVREIISNDKDRINAELEKKLAPFIKNQGGYILHSDHSIPPDVDHETLVYFFERGLELGREIWKQ